MCGGNHEVLKEDGVSEFGAHLGQLLGYSCTWHPVPPLGICVFWAGCRLLASKLVAAQPPRPCHLALPSFPWKVVSLANEQSYPAFDLGPIKIVHFANPGSQSKAQAGRGCPFKW